MTFIIRLAEHAFEPCNVCTETLFAQKQYQENKLKLTFSFENEENSDVVASRVRSWKRHTE